MSEIKPNVFPTVEQKKQAELNAKLAAYEAEKAIVTEEIYTTSAPNTPHQHLTAVEQMRLRTENQMKQIVENGFAVDESKAEITRPPVLSKQEQEILEIREKAKEQIKIRDERLSMNASQTQNYQSQFEKANERRDKVEEIIQPVTKTRPPIMQPIDYGKVPSSLEFYMMELSQPNYNSPFDVIPLPSEGKLYRNKKSNVKISYMTTADENILTSPNLLESGQFLQILINRKLLEPDLRFNDLHMGDRNALMLWLRATGFGEMYPVILFDENDVPFEHEINLNDLKYKKLGAEPDGEGLFDYQFPLSKAYAKFRFLTCGDIDDIDKIISAEKESGIPVDNSKIYKFERNIVEVNGVRDRGIIREFVNNLRLNDGKEFEKYIDKIESGVDLNITVGTPGGGSVDTFLPLNLSFFWPNFKL